MAGMHAGPEQVGHKSKQAITPKIMPGDLLAPVETLPAFMLYPKIS